jgi:dTDP-glucose 4,6-dehydratase
VSLLVTGAAGFIGSNLVRALRSRYPSEHIVSLDLLTYAGSLENLQGVLDDSLHSFVHGDITDAVLVDELFAHHDFRGVFHLAAESHVDRSIDGPMAFVKTNVEGTATLLDAASRAWGTSSGRRFVHVSTDEVFGSLGPDGAFDERTPYAPRSPYSATKAASDHLARAWHETYGLRVIVTNCTNNYGPYQFPEKLLPVVITRGAAGEPVPVYGRGENVRDWIHVSDHCAGLIAAFERGEDGETYCFGGEAELSNLALVEQVLDAVDARLGRPEGTGRALIRFVADRPGHDFRYAMDIGKARRELGWAPAVSVEEGLARTVEWYLDNVEWAERVRGDESRAFEERWYRERLATAGEVKS